MSRVDCSNVERGGSVSLAIIHCRQNGDLNTGIGNGDEMELELGETANKTTTFLSNQQKMGQANYRIPFKSAEAPMVAKADLLYMQFF